MMVWEINYKKQKGPKGKKQNERKKVYKPKKPFRTVEGIGCPAWEKLDMGAIGVLMKFYGKFNGYNRYDLSLTYKEVKDKMSSLIFSRYLWQCIGFGFLDRRRTGRLMRNCSLYGISNRWRKLSEEPEKLDKIEKLLKEIEDLKRRPGSSEKRMRIYKIRHKVLNLGKYAKKNKSGKYI